MSLETDLTHQLRLLQDLATAGFAIGLHVRFATPSYMFQTYPRAWLDIYSREGLLMQDPAIAWAFGNQGMVRWDDLASQDLAQVFPRAREHGLVHGMTISVERGGSRSIGGFARPDRFFTSEEVARIEDGMGRLHDLTDAVQPLPEPVRESLRKLSVAFTHP